MELTTGLIVRIIGCVVVSLILWLMSRGNWAAGNRSKRFVLFVIGGIAWAGFLWGPVHTQWQERQVEKKQEAYKVQMEAYKAQMKVEIQQAAEQLKSDLETRLRDRKMEGPMALYPFQEKDRKDSRLGRYLSERMLEALITVCSGRCRFVERERLEDALKELQFHASDLTDKTKASKPGKMVGARYILTGAITMSGDDKFELSLKIQDVETSIVLSSVNAAFSYSPALRKALSAEEPR